MLKLMFTSAVIAFSFSAAAALAHDGDLVGDGLDVRWTDHALVGTIDSVPLFADSLTAEFGIRMFLRIEGETFETVFKRQGDDFGSELITVRSGVESVTTFLVTEINAQDGIISGLLDQDEFVVKVSADSMDGAHYVNPRFDVRIADRSYEFHMENGQACMGCSVKIAFTVLTAKRSSGLW